MSVLHPLVSRVCQSHHWQKTPEGMRHRRSPITPELITGHLTGTGPSIGACPITPGRNTTRVAVFDLDSHKGETPWGDMQIVAQRLSTAADTLGLRLVPFRSTGGAGIHLIALWNAAQDAFSVREAMREALIAIGFKPGSAGVAHGEIEIFPKQDAVPSDGWGSQVILPLSGKSCALDAAMEDVAAGIDPAWRASKPVPVIEAPPKPQPIAIVSSPELKTLMSALDAIPNTGVEDALNYDNWFRVACAIHHATKGGDDGLALLHKFSAQSAKYDPTFIDTQIWPYIKIGRENAITHGTVLKMATEHGWSEVSSDAFEVLTADEADAIGIDAPESVREKGWPAFPLRDSNGRIHATLPYVIDALNCAAMSGVQVAYDWFTGGIGWRSVRSDGNPTWRKLEDHDTIAIQEALERRGFKPIAEATMRNALIRVAMMHEVDSAVLWLSGLQWDGVPRIDTFVPRYLGAADTAYTRACGQYLWTALAGRVLDGGCQADMALIFVGRQGTGKTSAVRALCPDPTTQFCEIGLADRGADTSRLMRGKLVGELAELKGLHTGEREAIKAFITRRYEIWRPLYRENETSFPRRLILIGTANNYEILDDPTGERRWLPIETGTVHVEAIQRDCLQLWAEAAARFLLNGIEWRDPQALAVAEHSKFKTPDAWHSVVAEWVAEVDVGGERRDVAGFTTEDALRSAIGLDYGRMDRKTMLRMAGLLRELNYVQTKKNIGHKTINVWRRPG